MTFVKTAVIAAALGVATLIPSIVPAEAASRGGRHFGAQPFRPHPGIPREVFKPAKRPLRPGQPNHPRHDKCEEWLEEYHDTGIHQHYLKYLACLHGYNP